MKHTTTTTSAEARSEQNHNTSGDILMGMIRQTLGEPIQATVEHNEQIKRTSGEVMHDTPDDNHKENNEHI